MFSLIDSIKLSFEEYSTLANDFGKFFDIVKNVFVNVFEYLMTF